MTEYCVISNQEDHQDDRIATQEEIQKALENKRYPAWLSGFPSVSLAEKRKFPSYWSGASLLLAAWWGISSTLTTAYAGARYEAVHEKYDAALSNITYTVLGRTFHDTLNPVTEDVLVKSFTVLELQAVDITAFYFVTAVPILILYSLLYVAPSEYRERNKITSPTHSNSINNTETPFDPNDDAYTKLSRRNALAYLLGKQIQVNELDQIKEYKPGQFEQLMRDMSDYSTRIAKYCKLFVLTGFGLGFYWLQHAFEKLKPTLGEACQGSPIWSLMTDACSADDLLQVLSLTSYVWLGMAAFWFSSFAGLMSGYWINKTLAACLPCSKTVNETLLRLDNQLEAKVHGEKGENKDHVYRDLAFYGLTFAVPVLLGFALYSSAQFAGELASENYCEGGFGSVLKNIAIGHYSDTNENTVCDSANMALVLAAFLGNFELGKVWEIGIAVKLASFLIGYLPDRYANSEPHPKAKEWRDFFDKKYDEAKAYLSYGVVIGGAAAFFPATWLANHILQNGWWQEKSLEGVVVQVELAPGCSHSIYHYFFRTVMGLPNDDCHPVLLARSFSGFVGPYWLCVTLGAASAFALAALVWPVLKTTVKKAASFCPDSVSGLWSRPDSRGEQGEQLLAAATTV